MKRALIIIDVQNDYFDGMHKITHPANSYQQILNAMDIAKDSEIPIALVQHTAPVENAPAFCRNTNGWKIAAEVIERPHDIVIEKNLPGSFTGTSLEEWLRGKSIDTVVIAGYMTQMCCDTTARQALHLGFKVEFLSDATGTHDFTTNVGSVTAEELHRVTLITQAIRFSSVMTVDEWAEGL